MIEEVAVVDVDHAPDTRLACLTALRDRGQLTVAELVAATRLSRPTVVSVVGQLSNAGLVTEAVDLAPTSRRGGRPARRHAFDPSGGVVVGIDVAEHRTRVLVADLGGQVLAESLPGTPAPTEQQPGLEPIVALVEKTLLDAGRTRSDLRAAGLGVAGGVDRGVLLGSPTVRSWVGRRVGDELAELLGVPVTMDNDLVLAASAEVSEGAIGSVGTGVYVQTWHHVSARITIEGQVLRGRRHLAGEVGLLKMFERLPVPEGNMLDRISEVDVELARLHENPDDGRGQDALARLVEAMTPAVATIELTVDPDVVVLGGGLGRHHAFIAEPLRRAVADFSTGYGLDAPIVGSVLGEWAVSLGALQAAFREHSFPVYGTPAVSPPTLRREPRSTP